MSDQRAVERWPCSFRELFCQKYRCPLNSFEKKLFWRSLYRKSWLVSRLIFLFNPAYFDRDLAVIQKLGNSTNPSEFEREIDAYQRRTRLEIGSVRVRWLLRISGRRLMRIKKEVVSQLTDAILTS